MLRARASLREDARSRLRGLDVAAIQLRLEDDREELDRWVVLAIVASFEATLRTDASNRVAARAKHYVTKPLRDLLQAHQGRVRFDDLLNAWESHVTVGETVRQAVRRLLKHRHWLAHGRHWTNKDGRMPSPLDAYADLLDYAAALTAGAGDFPLL